MIYLRNYSNKYPPGSLIGAMGICTWSKFISFIINFDVPTAECGVFVFSGLGAYRTHGKLVSNICHFSLLSECPSSSSSRIVIHVCFPYEMTQRALGLFCLLSHLLSSYAPCQLPDPGKEL